MKGIAIILRDSPRSLVIFSAAHVLLGLIAFVLLVQMHCVDAPCPPEMSCLDGCSIISDPGRDGDWPFILAIIVSFTVSSALILRGSPIARWVLLSAIVAWFAYGIVDSLVSFKDGQERNMTPGIERGWNAAWEELLGFMGLQHWLIPLGWIAFDAWFLFSARVRKHFRVVA
jgi:hypothetical protein